MQSLLRRICTTTIREMPTNAEAQETSWQHRVTGCSALTPENTLTDRMQSSGLVPSEEGTAVLIVKHPGSPSLCACAQLTTIKA